MMDCEDCKHWICVNFAKGVGICTVSNEETIATGSCPTFVRRCH